MTPEQLFYLNSCPPGDRHEVTVNGVTYVKDRRFTGMMFSDPSEFRGGYQPPLVIPQHVTLPHFDPGPPPPFLPTEVICSESPQSQVAQVE
jgi:hypothetical protein